MLSTKSQAKNVEEVLSLDFLGDALAVRAAYKIKNTIEKLMTSKATENEKINTLFALDVVAMA